MKRLQTQSKNNIYVRNNDIALIVGSAPCVFDDLERFEKFNISHDTICINRSVEAWGKPFLHWVALDVEPMRFYARQVREKRNVITHAPSVHYEKYKDFYDAWWTGVGIDGGTSAKFALEIALELGYKKIIIAGCPLTDDGKHFNDQKDSEWHLGTYKAWANFATQEESDKVKALSGYPKKILGEPTEAFLTGTQAELEAETGG